MEIGEWYEEIVRDRKILEQWKGKCFSIGNTFCTFSIIKNKTKQIYLNLFSCIYKRKSVFLSEKSAIEFN